MKPHHLGPLAASLVFLAACDQQVSESIDPAPKEVAVQKTEAPAVDVSAELAQQLIGKKLLGNTVALKGDAFEPADLTTAPEYYLAYYSASW